MAKVYVCVITATTRVVGIYRVDPEDSDPDHTCYHEEYTGDPTWNCPETEVYRDGPEDYRTVDLS